MLTHALGIVMLVFAGRVTESHASLAAYTRHVVEDGFLSRAHVAATYGGELDAPALPDAEPATVAALVASLPVGLVYLVTVPTAMQPIGRVAPYHAATWALVPLPGLPGAWQRGLSHELAEIACQWECADPCEPGTWRDGTYVYALYETDDGECA